MKPVRFIPGVIFLLISIVLLCLPGTSLPGTWLFGKIPQFDKMVHIGMFGTLCLLFHVPATKSTLSNSQRKRWFWVISIAAIVYGVGMEFVQRYMVAFRSFEEADILSDAVGSLAALAFSLSYFLKREGE